MTSEMRLLLARHGHATSGPDHRWTADDPLTELGHVQAQELGQHVAGLAARPDRIVSSTALRSLDTARACAAALDLPIATDARLIEFGSGAPTPYTLAEMFETQPYDDIWHHDDPGHDGEPIGAFHRRVADAIEDIWADGGAPLVVTHGGTTNGSCAGRSASRPSSPISSASACRTPASRRSPCGSTATAGAAPGWSAWGTSASSRA